LIKIGFPIHYAVFVYSFHIDGRFLLEKPAQLRTRNSGALASSSPKRRARSLRSGAIIPSSRAWPSLLLWHGWHAFRCGLATNLHALGVDDKTIQAILRHSNVSLLQNIYIKSVMEPQVSAMDSLSEKLGICNDLATPAKGPVN
jgi:integrase